MFGQNDNNQQQNQNHAEPTTVQPTEEPAASSVMQGFTPPPSDPVTPLATDNNAGVDPVASPALDVSADSTLGSPEPTALPGNLTAAAPVADMSAAPQPATTAPTPAADDSSAPAIGGDAADGVAATLGEIPDDLLNIKQEALHELSPLVAHLDQSPEERFRTTMMMIQATDDSTKIKDAYDAAQKIEDDKARAQALLDVVNEINYFTQQRLAEQEQ